METPWVRYRSTAINEFRPWTPVDGNREALRQLGISVSNEDEPKEGGMIARNPVNHADQWYVQAEYFRDNYEVAK